jgi:hypothetical protein
VLPHQARLLSRGTDLLDHKKSTCISLINRPALTKRRRCCRPRSPTT